MRPLGDQTVVITGASSGIRRLTAGLFGSRGARVALLARGETALQAAAEEVESAGGQPLPIPTDVADWAQVDAARRQVVERFGRIDSWVNNAGIAIYAPFSDLTPEEMRRMVEVNLLGEMYGSRAALDQMREQGEGVIVNVSSVLARRSVPLQSAYCAAKHGVTGFTESLREELARDHPAIHVVEVLPSSINSPSSNMRVRRWASSPCPFRRSTTR